MSKLKNSTPIQSSFARSLLSHLVMGEQEEENPSHLNILNKHIFFHRSRFILYEYEDLCINVNVLLKSLFRKQRCWPCTSISKKSGALHKLMIFCFFLQMFFSRLCRHSRPGLWVKECSEEETKEEKF